MSSTAQTGAVHDGTTELTKVSPAGLSLTSLDDVRSHRRHLQDGEDMTFLDAVCCAPFPDTNNTMWVSSPNVWFVPQPPYQPAGEAFGYHEDGMLGRHEYLKWPQRLYRPEIHSLAAPGNPALFNLERPSDSGPGPHTSSPSPLPFADDVIAWTRLDKSQDFCTTTNSSSEPLGTLSKTLLTRMGNAMREAQAMADKYAKEETSPVTADSPSHVKEVVASSYLFQCSRAMHLQRAFTTLFHYPMSWFDVLLWFREYQRLLLDLRAWAYYMAVVRPRLCDPSFHQPFPVLQVRGVVTTDLSVVADMFRIGVPVWHIREVRSFTTNTFVNHVDNFVDSSICLSNARTFVSRGKQVSAPSWTTGPGMKYLSSVELQRLSRKFALSNSPIIGLAESFDPSRSMAGRPSPGSGLMRDVGLATQDQMDEPKPHPSEPAHVEAADCTAPACDGSVEVGRHVEQLQTFFMPDEEEELTDTPLAIDADLDSLIDSLVDALQSMSVRARASSYRPKGEIRAAKGSMPPAWAIQCETVARIEEFMATTFRDDNSKTLQYHLPPPHLFYASTYNSHITVQKVHNWLRIRPWCFSHIMRPHEQRSTLMTTHQWRVALEGKYYNTSFDHITVKPKSDPADIAKLPPAPPDLKRRRTEPSDTATSNKGTQHRRIAARIDINVRFGVHAGFEPYDATERASWGRVALNADDIASQHDHALVREVVWELSVANFRLELLDLDQTILHTVYQHQDGSLAARRESLVCHIWQNGFVCPTWEDSVECDFLSSPSWEVRLPAVKQLAFIVSAWPGGQRFRSWNTSLAVNGAAFSRFEYDVLLFYSRTFSELRGRRPILPLIRPGTLASRFP